MFRHIYSCSEIILAYSEPCVTPAYSESWYIQNPGIFSTRGICRTLAYSEPVIYPEPVAYSEPCQASTKEHFVKKILTAIVVSQIIIILAISAFHVYFLIKKCLKFYSRSIYSMLKSIVGQGSGGCEHTHTVL